MRKTAKTKTAAVSRREKMVSRLTICKVNRFKKRRCESDLMTLQLFADLVDACGGKTADDTDGDGV
jgi:hypothetical protein